MIGNEVNPPLTPGLLAHYGVKGMKWGERKAKPTSAEIVDARIRQESRQRRVNRAADDLNATSYVHNKRIQQQAARNYARAKREYDTSEDRVTASHMTKGEKIATAILTGPLALAIIPISKAHTKGEARAVDEARRNTGRDD